MIRKFPITCFLCTCVFLLAACGLSEAQLEELAPMEKVKINWLALDEGADPDVASAEQSFVARLNQSQDEIEVVLKVAKPGYEGAQDLGNAIEAGSPLDIVGPYGLFFAYLFADQWMDIEPLAAEYLSLENYDPVALQAWRLEGKYIGLPLGYWPAVIYYNQEIFEKSGLPSPPHRYGEEYAGGGAWTIEKLAEIGPFLSLDVNGNNAASPAFDINQAIQWGLAAEGDVRSFSTLFGSGRMMNDNGEIIIPENMRAGIRWFYSAIWQKKFFPNGKGFGLYGGDPFGSGAAAMLYVPTWYTCCTKQFNWNIAAIPRVDGKVTSRLDHVGLAVHSSSEHPEAAARVLAAIVSDPGIIAATRVVPAYLAQRSNYLTALYASYPNIDWQVMVDSLNYPDDPPYLEYLPNNREVLMRLYRFANSLIDNANRNMDKEMDYLENDLQDIISK